ncbi:MAG: hypothetical protein ACK5M3_19690 [Dysgonomonas sp.]
MEEQNFNWTTSFNTAGRTMTHDFNSRVKMVVDFQYGFITRHIDDKEVDRIGFDKCFSLSDYTQYQEETAIIALDYPETEEENK